MAESTSDGLDQSAFLDQVASFPPVSTVGNYSQLPAPTSGAELSTLLRASISAWTIRNRCASYPVCSSSFTRPVGWAPWSRSPRRRSFDRRWGFWQRPGHRPAERVIAHRQPDRFRSRTFSSTLPWSTTAILRPGGRPAKVRRL